MFPMTITISNHHQLNAVLAALGGEMPTAATADVRQPKDAATTEKVEAKKPTKAQASTTAKTQEAPAPTQPTAEAAGDAAPESKGANSDAAQGGNDAAQDEQPWNAQDYKNLPEYQAVAKAVVEVAKVKGREAAAALLEKTAGVKSLPESLPSQGAAIIAAFQAEGA